MRRILTALVLIPAVTFVIFSGPPWLFQLVIALLASASGILVARWVDYVTNTDVPATVVTTVER